MRRPQGFPPTRRYPRPGVCRCVLSLALALVAPAVAWGAGGESPCRSPGATPHGYADGASASAGGVTAPSSPSRLQARFAADPLKADALRDAIVRARSIDDPDRTRDQFTVRQAAWARALIEGLPAASGAQPVKDLPPVAARDLAREERSAASVASVGLLAVEAFHALRDEPGFCAEATLLRRAAEQGAASIAAQADLNGDGRLGWGRLWIKGRRVHGYNLKNGGYTYFTDAAGCSLGSFAGVRMNEAYREEAFDVAHVSLFLLEVALATRDAALARRLVQVVRRAMDDSWDDGEAVDALSPPGWYYWKTLGGPCEIGFRVKNTNLRMGTALGLLHRLLLGSDPAYAAAGRSRYLLRARAILRTNDDELFRRHNLGYFGSGGRNPELGARLAKTQRPQRLPPDVRALLDGAPGRGSAPDGVLCGGAARPRPPARDEIELAGSCWNHLPFEAEDYLRIYRYGLAGDGKEAIRRTARRVAANLSASAVLFAPEYGHYFASEDGDEASNAQVNASYYGFFCLARGFGAMLPAVRQPRLDEAARRFLRERPAAVCARTPAAWHRGYKFDELYLASGRLALRPDDLDFRRKH